MKPNISYLAKVRNIEEEEHAAAEEAPRLTTGEHAQRISAPRTAHPGAPHLPRHHQRPGEAHRGQGAPRLVRPHFHRRGHRRVRVGCILYLFSKGIGVWGLNKTVDWHGTSPTSCGGGIGHAGTLISAVLLLFRQRWRMAVNAPRRP